MTGASAGRTVKLAMRRANPIPWLKDHPFAADALLGATLTVLSLLGLRAAGQAGAHYRRGDVWLIVLVLLANVPVAWRRRWPEVVLVLTGISAVLIETFHYREGVGGLGVLVALYSIAAHREDRRRNVIALFATVVAIAIVFSVQPHGVATAQLISNYVLFGSAWILGDNLRTRRAYVHALEERAALAEANRDAIAVRAVSDERARIARELHDVVAHGVSVMVVQAGAARRVIDREPAKASEAMSAIEATGRQALNELRRLLGMLRSVTNEPTGRAPQPGIDHLDELIAHTREAGLPVTLEIEGTPRHLAPGVDLSAYRIVQEALTNALKHAGPASATVRLSYGADQLEVLVTDDGRGRDPDRAVADGHGLLGMHERVALFDGELQLGNRTGGGFGVRATLPLEVSA